MTKSDQVNDNKQTLSTKLSIEDYNSFLTLTKLEYEGGLIKEQSPSELLRFRIRHILKQVYNQPEYHILEQQELISNMVIISSQAESLHVNM